MPLFALLLKCISSWRVVGKPEVIQVGPIGDDKSASVYLMTFGGRFPTCPARRLINAVLGNYLSRAKLKG
jgi:hypothetical protein